VALRRKQFEKAEPNALLAVAPGDAKHELADDGLGMDLDDRDDEVPPIATKLHVQVVTLQKCTDREACKFSSTARRRPQES